MSCSVALAMRLEWEGPYSSHQSQAIQFSDGSRLEGYLHAQWPLGAVCPNAAHPAS